MRLGSVLYLTGAGVAVQAAVVHLGVGLGRRPRDRTHLSFAALAFATAGFLISTWALHTTTAVADYVAVWRGPLFVTAAIALLAAIWFFTFWTGFRLRLPAIALSIATVAAVVVNFATPQGATVSGITRLQQVSFLGEPMTLHLAATEASALVAALNGALFLYLVVAATDAVRRRGLARSVPILAALMVMLLGASYDLLVDAEMVRSPYLLPLASLAVVAIMGSRLLGEVRATESDLARHNADLRSRVSAQTRDLQDVNADLVRRVDQLDRLREIARISATPDELQTSLTTVLGPIGRLLGADAVEFVIRDAERHPEMRPRWRRRADDERPRTDHGEDSTISGRPAPDDDPPSPGVDRAGRHVIHLPLRSTQGAYGSMTVERSSSPFTTDECAVAETVAADMAELVLRHELLAALRDAATIDERRRIARDMHDSVTQTMYAVSMLAEALPQTLDDDDMGPARQAARQIRDLSVTALAELRALLLELRPQRIASMTVPALLRDQADAVANRFSVDVDVAVDAEPVATADTKLAIQRVVRELLSNVARHADAAEVGIRLTRQDDGGGLVTIVDDGTGFTPDAVGADHHGLAIARERLARVGGHLEITSRLGHGTRAAVSWPAGEAATPAARDGGTPGRNVRPEAHVRVDVTE